MGNSEPWRHLLGSRVACVVIVASWACPASCQQDNDDGAQKAESSAPQERASNSDPNASSPTKSNSSDRIFGVVPAFNITDLRNPPLTSAQKFGLFAKGTLDPFPVVAYALQAGVSQASDTHSGYGQGFTGYGKRFGAALLDGTSARFLALTFFRRCCTRTHATSARAKEPLDHVSAIRSLEGL